MRRHIHCLLAAGIAAGMLAGCVADTGPGAAADAGLVTIAAGERSIRMSGQFVSGQAIVAAPLAGSRVDADFLIMRRQVSQAEYAACVDDGGCKALEKEHRGARSPTLPVVGVSWVDATAYAQWYSRKTGRQYRLPTYTEWAHAAGSAFEDISVIDIQDSGNPALRWLAEYALETARITAVDGEPKPFGTFGVASTGLQDIGGNVWDWTDTCFTTHELGGPGQEPVLMGENCGIRVLAGKHIGYIVDFIRDPRSGACSVGIPPSNLGIRLVLAPGGPGSSTARGGDLRQRLGLS